MKVYLYPTIGLNYDKKDLSNQEKWSIDKFTHPCNFICSTKLLENKSEYFIAELDEQTNKWLINALLNSSDKQILLGKYSIASNLVESYHTSLYSISNLLFNNEQGKGKMFKLGATMYPAQHDFQDGHSASCESGVTPSNAKQFNY